MIQVSPKTKKTSFKVELPEADSVKLVGEFTDWSATPMKKLKSGVWKAAVALEEGSYQFRYLVNDSQWLNDETAATVPNEFGTENSVAQVAFPKRNGAGTAKKKSK